MAALEDELEDAVLDDIQSKVTGFVLTGGEPWKNFMRESEERMGLPWQQIKEKINEREKEVM